MKNKICLITGGNSGIGKAAATQLAIKGASVVILSRSKERGEQAVKDIISLSGNTNIDLLVADLASQKSVRNAVQEFKSKYNSLHVLINNAAVFLPNRTETEEGIESTFAINYLSHFLLTDLLIDLLKSSAPSRIINVASKHSGITINYDDLMMTKKYSVIKAVGPTKLALVLFTKELAKRLDGSGVTVNSLHPGIVKSNLLNNMPWVLRKVSNLFSVSPEKGAETTVYLAASKDVEGVSGGFFVNCKRVKTTAIADDESLALKLWNKSMELIGKPNV
ncbi:SDR family oxidoreductase [Paenibacillus prosopidis]|uniref:NAD(P)-dependent dehydrogenase (Short-subunit alcohol dehydrogenase family) n=1 Tax=Paenibacillus prosopidis TaxID=630520 RepID=A0A368W2F5_9BACL|nr:SDR family oxidoreductase [Paenibacillus prosopidis]RCW48102.1 NAD(P)-dependent dehydrogenase (short-subunit alcohol dehydrogenase family) [Paenibacillus prosopidis]